MSSTVENLIVHKIEKRQNDKSVVTCRADELQPTGPASQLVEQVRSVYRERTGKTFGSFRSDTTNYPFSHMLKKHLDGTCDFCDMTQEAMTVLQRNIDRQNFATGGYVLFVRYCHDGRSYLMIVMLNDLAGTAIDAATLEVNEAIHLDLSALHLAARIDLSGWQEPTVSNSYLSFVKGRATHPVSVYFRDFIGCEDYADPKKYTRVLVQAVNDFCREEAFAEDVTRHFREKVYDFCIGRSREKEPVYLDELSAFVLPDEPNRFSTFAQGDRYSLNNVFDAHRSTLHALRRLSGHDAKLRISFDADILDERVFFNADDDTLTIKSVPRDLRDQIIGLRR